MCDRRILSTAVAVLALVAGVAGAGDVTGEWLAEFTTPNGMTREVTFHFEADGATLTGTVSGRRGDTEIEDGTVDGDDISFSVTHDFGRGPMKFLYEGTLSGDEIALTVTIEERDRTFDMTAKRVTK